MRGSKVRATVADPQRLAIDGGSPVRRSPLPPRRLFSEDELKKVVEVFERSWETGVDFGFQGYFEQEYTDAFCAFQGGGFADAVATGTAAIHLALATLNLPHGCDVIVSPVTDPGGGAPVVLQGFTPVVADSQAGSFNMGPLEFEAALTPNTRCAILTHIGGIPVDIGPIMDIAKAKNVAILEDCSQAHGAVYRGKRVGTFGDIAAFSTMFSKAHATGGCGGLVYTQDERAYLRCRALADRGKPFASESYPLGYPETALFPSLNSNLDEISCAIGLSTLARLQATIDRRLEIINSIDEGLSGSKVISPINVPADWERSPFFHTVKVNTERIKVPKRAFAEAVMAEGIAVNPDYRYVVAEWPWLQEFLKYPTVMCNAKEFRDSTFNLLFHEKFNDADTQDIIDSILKVGVAFSCG